MGDEVPVTAPRFPLLGLAALVGFVCGAGAVVWTMLEPALPGHEEATLATGLAASAVGLVAQLSALVTAGRLVSSIWLRHTADRSGDRQDNLAVHIGADANAGRAARLVNLSHVRVPAAVWGLASLAMVALNAADAQGMPVQYVFASFMTFFTSTQSAQAWALVAFSAGVVLVASRLSCSWRVGVVLSGITVGAAVPTVVTAQVSVGADHDLATDAAVIFTVLSVISFATVWGSAGSRSAVADVRVRRVVLGMTCLSVPVRVGIAAFELAGHSPVASVYGVAVLLLLGLLLALAVAAVLYRLIPSRRPWTVGRLLVTLTVGLQAAMTHLTPPRFTESQSIQQNLLGFNVGPPPQISTIWWPGRPNVLLTVIAVVCIIGYWVMWRRLLRRGDHWPASRALLWTGGWLVVLGVGATRVWTYSSVMFSWHMAAHMTLNMLAPPLLVLGGPITLLLKATSARPDGLPGVRQTLVELLGSPGLSRLSHPLLIWAVFVGSFYVLYFSGLFDKAMTYHWAHQLMTFHFLIIGSLFYGLAIGEDRPPRDVPPIARLAVIFAAMPFHAFFAVAVLAGTSTIGDTFYQYLDVSWMHDLAGDQQTGGQIAWATGELPLLIVIVSLVGQWFRQDQRLARRTDRASDAGYDDSLEAYNTMLTELAAREQKTGSLRP